jgi:hypothetical protein
MSEQKQINVDSRTWEYLKLMSKMSGVPMATFQRKMAYELMSVCINFSECTFSFDSSPIANNLIISVHGKRSKSAITFGTAKNEAELNQIQAEMIQKDIQRKAL